MSNVGFAQVCSDFAADFVAGVVDRHRIVFFAVKVDAGDIELLALIGLLDSFLWDFFNTALLALLEEAEGGFVGLVHGAAAGAFEFHEAGVGAAVNANGAKELQNSYFATVEEGGDFAADDIAAVGDGLFRLRNRGWALWRSSSALMWLVWWVWEACCYVSVLFPVTLGISYIDRELSDGLAGVRVAIGGSQWCSADLHEAWCSWLSQSIRKFEVLRTADSVQG